VFNCKPNVTSRFYDWWKQSKSIEEGDNNTIKNEEHYGITTFSYFVSKVLRGSFVNL